MSSTEQLVFISIDDRINRGEHYTLIADFFANFQHGILSFPQGKSEEYIPQGELTLYAIHEVIEWPIRMNAAAGDRYVVIAHALGHPNYEHDKLMITKHAEDMAWSLDDVIIVHCSSANSATSFQRIPFAEYFADLV